MSNKINYNKLIANAIKGLKNKNELSGENGVFTPIIKAVIEAALEEELRAHIGNSEEKNRKNGKARKSVKTAYGQIEIEPSRDRLGTYEPQFLAKRQTTLGKSLDHKVVSLYAKGISQADIVDYLKQLYGIDASKALISNITDNIIAKAREWQNRPLDEKYIILWLDASFFKVRENGKVVKKAVYSILGLNIRGHKELLGMYIAETESASFWLKVLNELVARGVKDVFIACIDNLKGFKEAIRTVFPKTVIQQCVVHKIRNTMGSVSTKDKKEFLKDLKTVYKAPTRDLAEKNLDELEDKWSKYYRHVIASWRNDWQELAAYFDYPEEIRKIMYTTNTIESFHSQIRKITKTKRVFSGDMSLKKLLYLVQADITKKWTQPMHNWSKVLAQLMIIFEDRLDPESTMRTMAN